MFFRAWLRANAALIIKWLQRYIPGDPQVGQLIFKTKEGVIAVAEITVPSDSAPLNARVSFLDSEGNEAPAQDVPAWTSSDENAVSLSVSEDGLSATANIGGPGASLIEVKSVTDDGDEIVAQGTITVTPGEPASGEVSFEEAPEGEAPPEAVQLPA
jgi:hypothetical protein